MEHMYNPYRNEIEEIKAKHKREVTAAQDLGFMLGAFVTLIISMLAAGFLLAGIK